MYFNIPGFRSTEKAYPKQDGLFNLRDSRQHKAEITVLTSLDHPLNKRFSLDGDGKVKKLSYQNALRYNAQTIGISSIDDIARIIEAYSTENRHILIRGLPSGRLESIRRLEKNFPEHPDGTPWAMLDFDNVAIPDGIDPLSVDAIEWVITKLPTEFHNASYYFQHSASAGIPDGNGVPLKTGLNVHLFFWFDRRISGDILSAYVNKHCIETGFYTIGANKGGVVQLTPGVDPAPIRSSVQPHFIAAPTVDAGVRCSLDPKERQGLVRKEQDLVRLPEIAADVVQHASRLKSSVVDHYKRQNGYVTKSLVTRANGTVATTKYSVAPATFPGQVRTNRVFREGRLSDDQQRLTLYFDDEGTPGSWYVRKAQPQIARRYGDDATVPLRELSLGAHEYVRDELGWFSEVPHRYLELNNGFLPPLASVAAAKVSLVLAPTGSGKTTAAIEWIRQRIERRELVFYAAPTIALVRQMQDDLRQAGLSPRYYEDVWTGDTPRSGVVVTTNDSLPRLLRSARDNGIPYSLILDEIHQGLDRFMGSGKRLRELERALAQSRQTLLLTGTLTDVQRHAVVEVVGQALGTLTVESYCGYEFSPVKRNPIEIRPTAYFDSDLVSLFTELKSKLDRGEVLPRFVLLADTSRMGMYRTLIEAHGLAEHAMIVSRPENTAEEIEAARVSTLPILISSPLFGLGLNFAREPDILWVRFDHIQADTSQIIQTVNRANRGQRIAEVRIYGNVEPEADFHIPDRNHLASSIGDRLRAETSLNGILEQHLHIDRTTYQFLRAAERNSTAALSSLVRDNGIQNFTVVVPDALPAVDKVKATAAKEARSQAREAHRLAITGESTRFSGGTLGAVVSLENLGQERRTAWRSDAPRVGRALEIEQAAIFVGCFGISDPAAAEKIDPRKVRRLLGEESPWISDQYNRETFPEWAKAEAEKTDKLIILLEKLRDLKEGRIDADGLSAALTRNGQLGDAFKALANNDQDYQSICRKIESLQSARANVRSKGGKARREDVKEQGLDLLREFVEPLGVAYGKKKSRGRTVIDNTKPIIPAVWNFDEMILILRRQAERLRALPVSQKVPFVLASEDPTGFDDAVPRQVCERCVYFHQNACALGQAVDWQSVPPENEAMKCGSRRPIKPELFLE